MTNLIQISGMLTGPIAKKIAPNLGGIGHSIKAGFHGIMLWLDSIIYTFVTFMYEVFTVLAGTNIFKEDFYQEFAQRIYVILGIVMLFVLAYSLLKAMVDPDQIAKGDKNMGKIVINFVTSLVICGLLPSIFSFTYNLQDFIVKNNTIGVLFFGNSASGDDISENFGVNLSLATLYSFLDSDNIDRATGKCIDDKQFGDYTCNSIRTSIQKDGDFGLITLMDDAVADQEVVYHPFISTAVGIFLLYVILTFCLDLAVRAVRLAFLQLIAPIPILMRVLPMKNDIFKNWLKKITASYLEVFTRILIMYLIVYFVGEVGFNFVTGEGLTPVLCNVLIIMGIFMFAKELPKLLSDVTGIDSGNIKLGIKDFIGKLGAGGALFAAGALGAGATTLLRNAAHGVSYDKEKGFGANVKQIGKTIAGNIPSMFAGAGSGLVRGGIRSASAKNFADVRKAAGAGAKAATDRRDRREAYRAEHSKDNTYVGLFGHMAEVPGSGVLGAHAIDALKNAGAWLGGGLESLEKEINSLTGIVDSQKKAQTAAESLRDKNANNAMLMTRVKERIEWKGTPDQVDIYKDLFDDMVTTDENGNKFQMSLEAIRSYVDSLSKQDTSGMSSEQLRVYTANVANYKSMLNQIEKSAWQTIESAAYDSALASDLSIKEDKFTEIRKNVEDVNNRISAIGDTKLNPADNKFITYDEAITKYENKRNDKQADYERKKREMEARQANRGGGSASK